MVVLGDKRKIWKSNKGKEIEGEPQNPEYMSDHKPKHLLTDKKRKDKGIPVRSLFLINNQPKRGSSQMWEA